MNDNNTQNKPDSSDLEAVQRANKERAKQLAEERAKQNRQVRRDYGLKD